MGGGCIPAPMALITKNTTNTDL